MHKMGLQSIAEASTSHSDVISIDSDSDGDEILLSDLVTKSKVSSSDSPPASSETVEQSDPLVTIHAGQCTDRDCPIPSCQMVKRFARHLKSCRKTNDNCHICKTLNTVLLSHSDNCRNVNCSFSFCKSTRAQIQRELEQQREKYGFGSSVRLNQSSFNWFSFQRERRQCDEDCSDFTKNVAENARTSRRIHRSTIFAQYSLRYIERTNTIAGMYIPHTLHSIVSPLAVI